jgi:branched-chain amino acid transport system substrate-binding protein
VGLLTLPNEELIRGSAEEVFDLIASAEGGWLFNAECEVLLAGAVVRLQLPMLAHGGQPLVATGRVVFVERPRRLVIEQFAPWPARLTCTITAESDPSDIEPEQCRVRVVCEVPEEALEWHLRRRGVRPRASHGDDEQPVGLLLSQSGPGNVFAGATENLARMAIDEINEDGPPLRKRLRLVVGDDGTSPAVGAKVACMLADEGCSGIVANGISTVFMAAGSALRHHDALLIFSLANEGGPVSGRLLRLGERPLAQLGLAIPRVMSVADGRRWFCAGNAYSWPAAVNMCAAGVIEDAGGTVVGQRLVPLGTRTFDPLIEAVERSGADCVLSTFVGADAAAFERQFYAAGLRDRCKTLSPGLDEATREHIGTAAGAGIWAVFGYFEDLPTTENRDFLKRYRERFGQWAPPPSSLSESVYETLHLLAHAVRRAGSWDPRDVARAMRSSRFRGPRGDVSIAADGEMTQELYLAEAVAGGYAVRA